MTKFPKESMKQEKKHHKGERLWQGFGFGIIGGALLTYFLGTKRGRELARKILDRAEGVEEEVEKLLKEFGREAASSVREEADVLIESAQENLAQGQFKALLGKLKSIGGRNFTKRFFLKDGKLQELL